MRGIEEVRTFGQRKKEREREGGMDRWDVNM